MSQMPTYEVNEAGFAVATQQEITDEDRWRTLYRCVVLGILMSLLWKASYYPLAYQLYQNLELADGFFPAFFRGNLALAAFMILPLSLGCASLLIANRWLFRIQAVATTVSMAGLCWHQGSYNDVTFLTCFWTSLLGLWLVVSMDQPWQLLLSRTRAFAMLIVSLMFLGGAVGKYTPAYWSGEVLYQIYFVDRPFWFFESLRSSMDDSQLRVFATYYSRMVILVETAGSFLWLLPYRIAGVIALSTLSGIVLFSNLNLLSVMLCLLTLCGIAIYQPAATDARSSRTSL